MPVEFWSGAAGKLSANEAEQGTTQWIPPKPKPTAVGGGSKPPLTLKEQQVHDVKHIEHRSYGTDGQSRNDDDGTGESGDPATQNSSYHADCVSTILDIQRSIGFLQ